MPNIKQNLFVSAFSYDPVTGATCKYRLFYNKYALTATNEQLAALLEKYTFIRNYDVDGDAVTVCYLSDDTDNYETEPIAKYMSTFCQADWLQIIEMFEQDREYDRIKRNAKKSITA